MSDAAPSVPELLSRIEELETRLADVESQLNSTETSSSPGYGDHRDQAVLAQLENGEKVNSGRIRRLYQTQTDIAKSRTLKRRAKSLLEVGPFEYTGSRSWIYTGGDDDV